MEAHHSQDTGTLRADALAALQGALDDPTGLEDVRVPDFDAGRPALRLRGEWIALDEATGQAVARYVDKVRALGHGYHLFGWVDADGDGQLG